MTISTASGWGRGSGRGGDPRSILPLSLSLSPKSIAQRFIARRPLPRLIWGRGDQKKRNIKRCVLSTEHWY